MFSRSNNSWFKWDLCVNMCVCFKYATRTHQFYIYVSCMYCIYATTPNRTPNGSIYTIFSYNNKMSIIEGKRSRDVFSYFGMCHHVCHSNIAMAMAENFASVVCRSNSSFPCVVVASSFRVNGNSNCYLMLVLQFFLVILQLSM